jgi:sugar phosphate isomerase/epimerase
MPYIPNVNQYLLDTIKAREPTSLGVTIDLEYMRYQGSEMTDIVEMFGSKLQNVHFRDGDGKLVDAEGHRRYLLPGDGDINLLETLRALRRAGYERAITIEVSHRQKDNIAKAKAFLDDCLRML